MTKLGFDHGVRVLGLDLRRGVDEELVPVARNGQAVSGERLRQLLRFVAQAASKALEEVALVALALQLDVNSPVVARHRRQDSQNQ